MNVQEELLRYPCCGIGIGGHGGSGVSVRKMLKFCTKDFNVIGKALLGELSLFK